MAVTKARGPSAEGFQLVSLPVLCSADGTITPRRQRRFAEGRPYPRIIGLRSEHAAGDQLPDDRIWILLDTGLNDLETALESEALREKA